MEYKLEGIVPQINQIVHELSHIKEEYIIRARQAEMFEIQIKAIKSILSKDWEDEFIVSYLRNYLDLVE